MAVKSNREFKTITPQGIEFIKWVCSGVDKNGSNKLSGKYPYNMKDGGIRANELVTANIIDHNGRTITNTSQYADAIIYWYNKYGEEFNINPNVLAAQGYQESAYKAYAYPESSTAMGISQFTVDTIHQYIINNFSGAFTESEIAKITNGITPIAGNSIKYKRNYIVSNEWPRSDAEVAIANKPILFRNVINNLDIMIKVQANYLRVISDFNNNIVASALSLYYAGPKIGKRNGKIFTNIGNGNGTTNFGAVVDALNSGYPSNRLNEALTYSRLIIDLLSNNRSGVGGRGFGFIVDRTKIVGKDLKNESISQPLRLNNVS